MQEYYEISLLFLSALEISCKNIFTKRHFLSRQRSRTEGYTERNRLNGLER